MVFIPNPDFLAELREDGDLTEALASRAEAAAAKANALGHRVRPSGGKAVEIVSEGENVRMLNTDYGGHIAEFGSKNNPPYAPLRRGVRATPGLRLEDERN